MSIANVWMNAYPFKILGLYRDIDEAFALVGSLYLYLFASMLSHLVTMDLSRFVQVEYSLINNEHKLDTLTNTT